MRSSLLRRISTFSLYSAWTWRICDTRGVSAQRKSSRTSRSTIEKTSAAKCSDQSRSSSDRSTNFYRSFARMPTTPAWWNISKLKRRSFTINTINLRSPTERSSAISTIKLTILRTSSTTSMLIVTAKMTLQNTRIPRRLSGRTTSFPSKRSRTWRRSRTNWLTRLKHASQLNGVYQSEQRRLSQWKLD